MQNTTPSTKPTLAIIDGFSFLFRAFYGVRHLSTSEGLPTNALYGFAQMLIKVTKDIQPHCCAVALEGKGKNFRNDLYPDYKANRSETPEDLIPQIPLLEPLIQSFDIPAIHTDTFEADDIIATLVKQYKATHNVVIISSDKDLMQLIEPGVTMLDTMKSKTIDEDGVMEKFGVTPNKVIDAQALIGDSSDNVPGVPSIGPKTAAELINTYGSLEGLYNNLHDIKQQKRREKLEEHKDLAFLSKKLVTLVDDVNLHLKSEDLRFHPTLDAAAHFLTEKLEFTTLANRLLNGNHFIPNTAEPTPIPSVTTTTPKENNIEFNTHPFSRFSTDVNASKKAVATPLHNRETTLSQPTYITITTMDELNTWVQNIQTAKLMCIDTETNNITAAAAKLVGISLSYKEGLGAYIPLAHTTQNTSDGFDFGDAPQQEEAPQQLPTQAVLQVLKPLLEDTSIVKIAQNLKYDWQILAAAYCHQPNTKTYHTFIQNYEDTLLMSFCLNGGKHNHGMDFLSEKYLGVTPIAFKDVCGTGKSQITFDDVSIDKATPYAAEDADLTLRLYHLFHKQLTQPENDPVFKLYKEIERPLVPVLAAMEQTGVAIDKVELSRLALRFQDQMTHLEEEIFALAGRPFNIASPKQLGEILFDEMNIPSPKKNRSTNVDVMEKLAEDGHAIAKKILSWRHAAKLKSTYADALAEKIVPATGRIHTHYHQTGASTGRFSSSDPNLQNIPTRTEDGRRIRKAFIATEGYWMASLDYSQIELRLLAHFSQSEPLMDAFIQNKDIHARTAQLIFGDDATESPQEQRRAAKIINFGIVYGMGPVNLASQTGKTRQEAATFIERYFEKYAGVRQYMNSNKEEALSKGYVTTLFGRRVHLPNIDSTNPGFKAGAERAAINAPLQGSNADIIKKAMTDIQNYLIENNKKTRMLMQVHDELIFEGPENEKDVLNDLKTIMEHTVKLSVPLKVEGEIATNWADAH